MFDYCQPSVCIFLTLQPGTMALPKNQTDVSKEIRPSAGSIVYLLACFANILAITVKLLTWNY